MSTDNRTPAIDPNAPQQGKSGSQHVSEVLGGLVKDFFDAMNGKMDQILQANTATQKRIVALEKSIPTQPCNHHDRLKDEVSNLKGELEKHRLKAEKEKEEKEKFWRTIQSRVVGALILVGILGVFGYDIYVFFWYCLDIVVFLLDR